MLGDGGNDSIREYVRAIYGDQVVETADRLGERYECLAPSVNAVVQDFQDDTTTTFDITVTGRELAALLGGLGSFINSDQAITSIVTEDGRTVDTVLDTASSLVACAIGASVPDEVPSWLAG